LRIGEQKAREEARGEELGFPTYGVTVEMSFAPTALAHTGRFDELGRLMDLAKFPPDPLRLASAHRDAEAVAALDELIASRSSLELSEDETAASFDMVSLRQRSSSAIVRQRSFFCVDVRIVACI
jgi:hypothetical protein